MTKDEAIKRFQRMKKILSIPNSDAARTIEALDMAIEALTHKIHTETHDSDLISRMSKPISMEESLKDIEPWYEDDNLSEPITSEELFKDLGIDDEAEAISREDTVTLNSPITIQAEMMPVVRCKDCRHHSYEGWCDVYMQPRTNIDFCNHGERQCNYFGEKREK